MKLNFEKNFLAGLTLTAIFLTGSAWAAESGRTKVTVGVVGESYTIIEVDLNTFQHYK